MNNCFTQLQGKAAHMKVNEWLFDLFNDEQIEFDPFGLPNDYTKQWILREMLPWRARTLEELHEARVKSGIHMNEHLMLIDTIEYVLLHFDRGLPLDGAEINFVLHELYEQYNSQKDAA